MVVVSGAGFVVVVLATVMSNSLEHDNTEEMGPTKSENLL